MIPYSFRGVAVYSGDASYLNAKCTIQYGRITRMFDRIDGDRFKQLIRYIEEQVTALGLRRPSLAIERGVAPRRRNISNAGAFRTTWHPRKLSHPIMSIGFGPLGKTGSGMFMSPCLLTSLSRLRFWRKPIGGLADRQVWQRVRSDLDCTC